MNGNNGNGISDTGLALPGNAAQMFNTATLPMSVNKKDVPKKGPKTAKRPTGSAPKRFKSSFIFFSMAKHKEIKEELAKDNSNKKIPNITKLVSDAWRNITPEDRAKYDALAKEDKERYEKEKASYTAPPGASKKKMRDPAAPRRPMSAFLAFANSRRAQVKAEKPAFSNGEISKVLSTMWKEASVEVKQKYRDDEAAHWVTYKAKMAEYRKKVDGMQKRAKEMQAAMDEMKNNLEDSKTGNEDKANGMGNISSESGIVDHNSNLAGILNGSMDMSAAPNSEDMMAASALRGVGGGANLLLGSGLQQAPVANLGGYGALLGLNPSSGLGSFAGGLGTQGSLLGNSGLMPDMANPTNRALLELGLPLQQLSGYPLGNQLGNQHQQALLMAQALQGAQGSYQIPFLGGGLQDQQTPLSQLSSLMGAQNALMRENLSQAAPPPSNNNSNNMLANEK